VKDWTDDEISRNSSNHNDEIKTEGALRSEVQMNIKRLIIDIGCYRGLRHRLGLLYVDNVPAPMHVPAKVEKRPLQERKKHLKVKKFKNDLLWLKTRSRTTTKKKSCKS
jgi:hypothetical protein